MGAYIDLQEPDGGLLARDVRVNVADHLRDVWRLKRLTQLGVYSGILLTEPVYYFVLHYTPFQLLIGLVIGIVIATTAIEGAFTQVFKLRKRSAYPGSLSLELGGLPTFEAACQGAASILGDLLRARGSFLALRQETGFLSLVALHRLTKAEAERYLRAGASGIQRVLESGRDVTLRADEDLSIEAVSAAGQQIILVPVRSFQGVIGLVGLLAERSNPDLRDPDLLAALGYAIGVSLESLRHRDELKAMASVDELTRVYNRRYFFDQLDRELASAVRYETAISVIILDLDDLKLLNDNFGHEVGDTVLRTMAQRLVRYGRASDIVSRLGGDEFAIILPRTEQAVAKRIVRRLKESVEADAVPIGSSASINISTSCGFASYPHDAEDASHLVRLADGRMYAAKAARRAAE